MRYAVKDSAGQIINMIECADPAFAAKLSAIPYPLGQSKGQTEETDELMSIKIAIAELAELITGDKTNG